MELVGTALGEAFAIDSKPIDLNSWETAMRKPIERFTQKRNERKETKLTSQSLWQDIYTSLCNYCKDTLHLEEAEKDKAWTRFFIKDPNGNNWLILAVINQNGDKSIAVRYLTKNQPMDKDFEQILSRLQSIDGKFKPQTSNGRVIWIGKLALNARGKDTEAFVYETKKLLDSIFKQLSTKRKE